MHSVPCSGQEAFFFSETSVPKYKLMTGMQYDKLNGVLGSSFVCYKKRHRMILLIQSCVKTQPGWLRSHGYAALHRRECFTLLASLQATGTDILISASCLHCTGLIQRLSGHWEKKEIQWRFPEERPEGSYSLGEFLLFSTAFFFT